MKRIEMAVATAQGSWLRATLKMDSPATGPNRGTVGVANGSPLRLGVIGESSAAVCGVDHHDDGFAGSLAREIAARAHRAVQWQVVGQLGATVRRIRHRLLPQLDDDLNVAVLLAGGNDVLTGCRPEQWRDDFSAILANLTERADDVIVAGVPPFAFFPSIPATLGRYLSERAAMLDEESQQVCATHPSAIWVTTSEVPPPEFFAADRFHLSAAGYHRSAQVVADHLLPGTA